MTDPVMTATSDESATPPDAVARRPLHAFGRALRAIGRFLLHWRAPLILLPLLVGLGFAALLGGRMLWAEVPTPTPAPRPVTCWDGSQAPRADCPAPEGAAGLHWVFPSFRPKVGECVEASFAATGGPRPTQYDCVTRLRGELVTVSYSQRSTLTRGLSYFAKRYPGIRPSSVAGGDRVVYRDAAPRSDGTFEVTASFTQYPYAVTVSADSLAVADAGLEQLVTFRPAAFVLVRPPR